MQEKAAPTYTTFVELFDAYLEAKSAFDKAEQKKAAVYATAPAMPVAITSESEWQLHIKNQLDYLDRSSEACGDVYHAEETLKNKKNALLEVLPYNIWFKRGDLAFRHDADDFENFNFIVKEWSDDLRTA